MKKKIWILAVCAAVLAAAIVLPFTLAKYSDTFSQGMQPVEPAPFYFETDLKPEQTYYVAAGADLTFVARNHDTLLHVTGEAITFDVAVNGTSVGTYTCTASVAENKQITIPAAQLGAVGAVKRVTLTSTAPYAKEIGFNVQVVETTATNCYSVKDMGDYVRLDLHIGDALPATDITIVYEGLAPDSTNDLTASWTVENGNGTLAVANLLPYARYTLYFFGNKSVTERTNVTLDGTITLD